jgi:hypothetical protein
MFVGKHYLNAGVNIYLRDKRKNAVLNYRQTEILDIESLKGKA